MAHSIVIKTQNFMHEFAKFEVEKISKCNLVEVERGTFEINNLSEKKLCEIVYNLLYFSRTIENVYLKDNGELIDLIGFNLTKRDYKLNMKKEFVNPLISVFLFYKLGLHKKRKFKVIDPMASLGELIIECSLFRKTALNIKSRFKIPLKKIFSINSSLPKETPSQTSLIAVCQDDLVFKKLKENINYSSQKIKVSKYDLDWLDVKFSEAQMDYVICQFPTFNDMVTYNEFQNDFFYQAEFVSKNSIGIITKEIVNKKYLDKYDLEVESLDEIEVDGVKFYVYVIN